jgi:hypothetical protein
MTAETHAHQIYVSFFDNEFYEKIEKFASDILEKHLTVDSNILPEYAYTYHTQLQFYCRLNQTFLEINKLIEDCNLKLVYEPLITFMKPNQKMGIHVDGYDTNTKILLPIWPKNKTTILKFYNDYDEDELISSISTEINRPIVFNASQQHGGVITLDEWRCSLQIPFVESFDEISNLIKSNTLFKTIKTSIVA